MAVLQAVGQRFGVNRVAYEHGDDVRDAFHHRQADGEQAALSYPPLRNAIDLEKCYEARG